MKEPFPPLTEQPVICVDGTPDEDYPLRILRVYRRNCESIWLVVGLSDEKARVYKRMNEDQRKRAEILDRAIARLAEAEGEA